MFGYWHVDQRDEAPGRTASLPPLVAEWGFLGRANPLPTTGWKGDLMFSPNMPPLGDHQSTNPSNGVDGTDVTDLIVMLPGNPGVVDWYREMMEKIVAQSKGKVAMLVVGFLGHHSGRMSSTGKVALLQEQIENIDIFLKTVVIPSVPTRMTVHIAGHSIGAFIAAHMAARHPRGITGKCFMLAPTICNMLSSPNGAKNDKLVNWFGITLAVSLATMAIKVVPLSLLKGSIRCLEKTPMQEDHLEIAIGMGKSCPGMLKSMLWMARSEFDQLTSIDPHLLSLVGGDRTVAYFVEHDGWVPRSDVALFRQNCAPGSNVVIEANPLVPHAFVLGFIDPVIQNGIAPFIDALQA